MSTKDKAPTDKGAEKSTDKSTGKSAGKTIKKSTEKSTVKKPEPKTAQVKTEKISAEKVNTEERPADESSETEGVDNQNNLTELYENMSQTLKENLDKAGSLTEEAFEKALRETKDWAGRMKEHYSEDISRVSEFLKRDWHSAINQTREQTRKSLDLDRIQVGVMGVLAKFAKVAGSSLETFSNKLAKRLTYKTGEIAGAGTLECASCGQKLIYDKPTRIPPCPKCRSTGFRRSF